MMDMEKCVPQWLRTGILPGQVAVSDNVSRTVSHIIAGNSGYEVIRVALPEGENRMFAAVRRFNLLDPRQEAYGVVTFGEHSDFYEVEERLLDYARPKVESGVLVDEVTDVPSRLFRNLCKPLFSYDAESDEDCMAYGAWSTPAEEPRLDEDAEGDAALEAQRREWEDRLSAMVMEYVARFHCVPDIGRLEQIVRGKLSLHNPGRLSAVTVSGDMRIYLPDYNEMELRMTPLARTLYIFFLCHPEGLCLSDIPDYAEELAEIYLLVKPGADEELACASIADLTSPLSESLQQKLSLTRRAVRRQILVPAQAEHYLIKGERGGKYGIGIPAGLRHLPAVLRR